MALFGREDREEADRVKKFGELLAEVRQPDFWKRLRRKQVASGLDDSLVRAIERRAERRGIAPDTLFGEYLTQVRSSTYPTADCFDADAVQGICASQAPCGSKSKKHLCGDDLV
jgi:hypothetical protein